MRWSQWGAARGQRPKHSTKPEQKGAHPGSCQLCMRLEDVEWKRHTGVPRGSFTGNAKECGLQVPSMPLGPPTWVQGPEYLGYLLLLLQAASGALDVR